MAQCDQIKYSLVISESVRWLITNKTRDGDVTYMEHWLDLDEAKDAVFSLEVSADHLEKAGDDPRHWKWVIIALHNALQGFMVLVLRGSNSLDVLKERSRKKWMEAYNKGEPIYLPEDLDNFNELYEKIQKPKFMLMSVESKTFSPSGTQSESVEDLRFLRNSFIHFVPKMWSIEVSGCPQLVEDCVGIIHFLVFDSGNILWHDESLEGKTGDLIEQIRRQDNAIAAQYGVDLVRHPQGDDSKCM